MCLSTEQPHSEWGRMKIEQSNPGKMRKKQFPMKLLEQEKNHLCCSLLRSIIILSLIPVAELLVVGGACTSTEDVHDEDSDTLFDDDR